MLRLVVFDLDGTLVDSRRDLATAANELVREYGGTALSEDAVGNMVGEGAAVLVRRALASAGLSTDLPGALERFLDIYDEHLLDSTTAYPGILDLLEEFHRHVPLGVLTNKPRAATDRVLAGLGLDRFFRIVVGGDSEHGRKPQAAGLRHIARTLAIELGDAMLVGDSPIDLETSRQAGCRVCLVAYGFGYRPVELRGDEVTVASVSALANHLRLHAV